MMGYEGREHPEMAEYELNDGNFPTTHTVEFRSLKKGIERGAWINLFAAGQNGKKKRKKKQTSGNDGIRSESGRRRTTYPGKTVREGRKHPEIIECEANREEDGQISKCPNMK